MENKKCSKCGEVKILDDFEKDSSKKDGRRADCRVCSTTHRKISREKHKKKNAIKAKNHRLNNIEKFKKKDRKYYNKNKHKIIEYQKEYAKNNKAKCTERLKKWRINNKEYASEYARKYQTKNKKHIYKKAKEYRIKNKDTLDIQRKKYYQENKRKIAEYHKEYRKNNKAKRNELGRRYAKNKRKTNMEFKILCNLRARMYSVLRYKGAVKSDKTLKLIGCDGEFLLKYLESKFLPGMTWENYGVDGWHIDHSTPCVSFNLTEPEQQKECFHHTNLKPMWAEDNLKKGAKYRGINYRRYKNAG